MYRIAFLLALFICSQSLKAQTEYRTIKSSRMGEERQLKIQLPRNYDKNKDKTYPLIIVLDGDYLFEPIAGNVDLYSYWDEIPESIVVGVNQASSRNSDVTYDDIRYLPHRTGADFFEFLGMELLPYLRSNFRTARFAAIAGHDITANFTNYFLFKEKPLFDAYINLSPDLAPQMRGRLAGALENAASPKWFYLATGTNDVPELQKSIDLLDEQLSGIQNKNLVYSYDKIDGGNHYSLLGQALPKALEMVFSSYPPISPKEYDEIVASDESPFDYLQKKYKVIEKDFGLNIPVRLNDFLAIGKALEFRKDWKEMEKLGELALKQYPNSIMGVYYIGRSYEENGKFEKALKIYQNAYGQKEVAYITLDFLLQRAEKIKQNFGS